jgi:hypothetical protein
MFLARSFIVPNPVEVGETPAGKWTPQHDWQALLYLALLEPDLTQE